tara:strand:+ start:85 stop:774 length:690 start_codon:yes stop_codon:yes gene_type:complete
MKMNRVLRKDDPEAYESFFERILDYNNTEHGQKEDALLKWSTILEAAEHLEIEDGVVLDAGCGPGHLSLFFIEKGMHAILIDMNQLPSLCMEREESVTGIVDDFFSAIKSVDDNSVDFVFDACAVTHFDIKTEITANDGLSRAAKEINRVLKPGGYFICASDAHNHVEEGEFVMPDIMKNLIEESGLVSLEDDISYPFNHCLSEDPNAEDETYYVAGGIHIVRLVFRKP